ncbi:MAG: ATP-binding protein [Acidimicrobiales bacterium]
MDDQEGRLRAAIDALEAQRELLGDDVVDTAQAPLRVQLADLAPPSRTARRQVTVVFADLSGYTSISEGLDPEEVMELLAELWDAVDAIFAAEGGTVVSHMGDGVMAVWGNERASEDDAERAVRATMRAVAHVADHGVIVDGERRPASLTAGVHTGQVHIGRLGAGRELAAIGDTTNVAARLESMADPSQVLISRETFHHVRGVFDAEVVGELELRNRRRPVTAHAVTAERGRAFRTRRRGVEGLDTTLVGRTVELERLRAAHLAVTLEADSRAVVLLGDPGLGKSRLLTEYRDWVETQTKVRVRYFEGRCVGGSAEQPFSLLRSILAHRFEISDSDPPAVAVERLGRGIESMLGTEWLPTVPTIAWLVGFDAAIDDPGAGDGPGRRRAAVASAVDLFAALTGVPSIMLLEDLHWADDGSLDVLERVVGRRPAGLVVVASTRPELRSTHPAWCADGGLAAGHEVVELGPLSDDAIGGLVDDILRLAAEPVPDVVALVAERAEGNPFHAEELVKMLIDDGVIETGDVWQVHPERLDELRVPLTLVGVLQARLDRLSDVRYRVLQAASVLGRYAWAEAIAALSEIAVGEVSKALDGLVEAEFIHRRTSRLSGHDEVGFNHDLTRAVCFDTIGLRDRPALHARAAAWLQESAGARTDEFAVAIAHHLMEAGDGDAAADWWERAGALARAQAAYREAANHYGQAAALTSDPTVAGGRVVRQADVACMAGDFDGATALLAPLIDTAGADAGVVAEASGLLSHLAAFRDGDVVAAETGLQRALDLLDREDGGADRLGVRLGLLRQQANLALATNDFERAAELCRLGLDLADDSMPGHRGLLANSLANALARLGRTDEAIATARFVAEVAAELGHHRLEMAAWAQQGLAALVAGDGAEAHRLFTEAQAVNRLTGDPEKIATVANFLGESLLIIDRPEEAAREFLEAGDVARQSRNLPEELRAVAGLAVCAALGGRRALAERVLGGVTRHPAYGNHVAEFVTAAVGRLDLTPADAVPTRSDPTDPSDLLALLNDTPHEVHHDSCDHS